ncbi:hypothetical protein ACF3MZ_06190 [Paenibacillaceae bacterium WGS1546]|uniref:hypothetical protein n=1 Tax=Cohnella sp. WGS1546 TaxID=3366810 RepID=UPI00372D72EB
MLEQLRAKREGNLKEPVEEAKVQADDEGNVRAIPDEAADGKGEEAALDAPS